MPTPTQHNRPAVVTASSITKLRSLALAATPGPWCNTFDGRHTDYMVCVDLPDDNTIIVDTTSAFNAAENAAFIAAASPDVVLSLLDQLAAAQGEVAMWKGAAVRSTDALREWRNWSDEVAPPFGSTRDRSDAGQRAAIDEQLRKALP
jgi:hypothetical protein